MFLDRDGVLNELIYYQEHGIIDSPFTVSQFKLLPGVAEAIKDLRSGGYGVVLASNQPGIAKEHMDEEVFEAIRQRMKAELAEAGACLDGEYYCLHHPEAKVPGLKTDCECRKPRPGLLFQAAIDLGIDLSSSWMIGDGLTDVIAGRDAGCQTILLGRRKCEFCLLMDNQGARPDAILPDLPEATRFLLEQGA